MATRANSTTSTMGFGALVAATLFLASCSNTNEATEQPDETNEVVDGPSSPEVKTPDVEPFSIGGCISSPLFLDKSVSEVSCEEAHFGKIFDEVELADDDSESTPSQLAVDQAIQTCGASEDRTVGEVFLLPPETPAWNEGDRSGKCVAAVPFIPRKQDGTLKGSGQLHQSLLQAGDCFGGISALNPNGAPTPESTVETSAIPCNLLDGGFDPGENGVSEVFATVELEVDSFPEADEAERLGSELCGTEAEAAGVLGGGRKTGYLLPSEADWLLDAQQPLVCVIQQGPPLEISPEQLRELQDKLNDR